LGRGTSGVLGSDGGAIGGSVKGLVGSGVVGSVVVGSAVG
jgi:hypothetical protein